MTGKRGRKSKAAPKKPSSGRRGPSKTPVSVLKQRGTFRADRHSDAVDLQLESKVPTPPPHFGDAAVETWNAIGEKLAARGLLTELDSIAFELLVSSYHGMREASDELSKTDLVVEVGEAGALQANPLVGIIAKHNALLKWSLSQFGCTPAARTSVKPDADSKPVDPMAALLAKK